MEQEQNAGPVQKQDNTNGVKGMTVIVKTIASWVKVLIFLFGIYIILFGHLTPGGGFAGGVILASSYILLMLAFGGRFVQENLSLGVASKLDCVGALLFAAVALCGLLYGAASFFLNFIHREFLVGTDYEFKLISAGTIPLSNIAIGLKVAASLFLVILVLSMFRSGPGTEQGVLEPGPDTSGGDKE